MGVTADGLDPAVLDAVAEQSPVHVLDLAGRLDEHPVAVDLACARLRDRGDVRLVGRAEYALAETGRTDRTGARDTAAADE